MKIKNIAKNLVSTFFKLLWAVLCYLFGFLLAVVSAYFTIVFYSDGSKGNDFYIMSFLAVSLEGVKLIFSIGYPYLKDRDKKNEKTVLLILKVSFFISVLSSVYFLLLGSDIEKSPASRTVSMLYQYIPVLNIIPLGFAQFISTISLSLLVEFFIIFLPVIAPVMFYEKNPDKKIIAVSNFEKIKEIFTVIPDMIINRLHKKVMKIANEKYDFPEKIHTNNKPKLKVLKRMDFVKIDRESNDYQDSDSDNVKSQNQVINLDKSINAVQDSISRDNKKALIKHNSENDKLSNAVLDSNLNSYKNDDKKILLKAMFKLKENNICPSVRELEKETKLTKNRIHDLKKDLEELEIIKTDKNKTLLLSTYKESLRKLKKVRK